MNELHLKVEKMLLSGQTIGNVLKEMLSCGYSKKEIEQEIKKCSATYICKNTNEYV